jgi:outer membrane autotransporter protein
MALGYAGAPAYAVEIDNSNLAAWTQAYSARGTFEGDTNAATANRRLGGFITGMDTRLPSGWRLGLAAGYSQSHIAIDSRRSRADVESFHVVGYAGGSLGPLALRLGGAWTWNAIDTSRNVLFPGFNEWESASYSGNTSQIFGEAAYPTAIGKMAFEPFAGLAYVNVGTGSFEETGGVAALAAPRSSADGTYFTLGFRAATTLQVFETPLTPRVSVAWQHGFGNLTSAASLVFSSAAVGFDVTGIPPARDNLQLEGGVDLDLTPNAKLGIFYSGRFASGVSDNGINGRFTWSF